MTTIAHITRRAATVLAVSAVVATPAFAGSANGGIWKTTDGGQSASSAVVSLGKLGRVEATQVAQTREHVLLARQVGV